MGNWTVKGSVSTTVFLILKTQLTPWSIFTRSVVKDNYLDIVYNASIKPFKCIYNQISYSSL